MSRKEIPLHLTKELEKALEVLGGLWGVNTYNYTQYFDTTPTRLEQFVRFHILNPRVYKLFTEFSTQMWDKKNELYENSDGLSNFVHYGAKDVIGRIRWHVLIDTFDDFTLVDAFGKESVGFKINDIYTPYYSRMLMWENEDMEGFFRTRKTAHADVFEKWLRWYIPDAEDLR